MIWVVLAWGLLAIALALTPIALVLTARWATRRIRHGKDTP